MVRHNSDKQNTLAPQCLGAIRIIGNGSISLFGKTDLARRQLRELRTKPLWESFPTCDSHNLGLINLWFSVVSWRMLGKSEKVRAIRRIKE
jgi:hypothetical protein